MLIALFTILILGGSSTALLDFIANTGDNVKVVMSKGEEQKQALRTIKAMKTRTNARNKRVKRAAKDLNKAFGNDDTTNADIDAIWDGYFSDIDQYNHDMLDLRFELREYINREEWQEIFPGD